jgi:hypothetical protein
MKVNAKKILIFSATLLFGLIAVWNIGFSFDSPIPTDVAEVPPVDVPFVVPATNRRQEFEPEFFDLPNFEDDASHPPDGKLIEMFEDGIYRRSDMYAENGQSWLVLTRSHRKEYELKHLAASVKLLNSVSWPGDEKDARLSFKTDRQIVFAVREIDAVKPGPILTLFDKPSGSLNAEGYSDNEELSDGYRREFRIGSNSFVVRTSQGLSKDGTEMAVLVVESGGKSQIVKRMQHVPSDDRDIIGSLYWAGDLDRDGELDFYLSEFNEKGFTLTELFLSSHSKADQLVGVAGFFAAAGC